MEKRKKWAVPLSLLAVVLAVAGHYLLDPWGYYWKVSPQEAALRAQVVETAEDYLGYRESDGTHRQIVDRYNAQDPLPMGYLLQYTDSWCAAFVSAMALELNLTEIIPPECGCQRQIALFQELGRWEEDDWTIPAPGDLIYYNWDQKRPGENTGWSDHVGIVVGVKWPFLKVIEGNRDDQVAYRVLLLGDISIRGYGLPDYASRSETPILQ